MHYIRDAINLHKEVQKMREKKIITTYSLELCYDKLHPEERGKIVA